jgi:SAM-dependent methyltransferase
MSTGERRRIVTGGTLDLALLRSLMERPAPFAPGSPTVEEEPPWADPAVAEEILRHQLEWRPGESHRASLDPELFDHISDWLIGRLGLRPGQRVLDLGCGAGLYAESLARRGLGVTGIDIVPLLVEHASGRARERGLAIEYRLQDFRTLEDRAAFDAILQLGGAFEGDGPDRLAAFLRRVREALRPGGHYVAELLRNPLRTGCRPWWGCGDGVHGLELVLGQPEEYPEHRALLQQSVVIREDGTLRLYRSWQVDHTPATAAALLERHGFAVEGCWEDVTGRPYTDLSEMLLVVARAV